MTAQGIYINVSLRNDDSPQLIEALKQLLLKACIREARWIGKHPNSLKLQKVPIEEFEQTFDYGLKNIIKLDDFNQLFDWENSSFYITSSDKSKKSLIY